MEVIYRKKKLVPDNFSNKRKKMLPFEYFENKVKEYCDNNIIPDKKEIEIKTKECLICMSEINENEIINIHEDHFYMCQECLVDQGKVLLRNRYLLPWKCPSCQDEIALNVIPGEDYNKLVLRQMETIIDKTVSCDVTYCPPNDFNEDSFECYICNSIIQIN
jgi:hypothetical protein